MYNREFYGNNDAAIHLIHRTYYTRAAEARIARTWDNYFYQHFKHSYLSHPEVYRKVKGSFGNARPSFI